MNFDFDLRPLIWLAVVGLVCTCIVAVAGGWWLGWHLIKALSLYMGAS